MTVYATTVAVITPVTAAMVVVANTLPLPLGAYARGNAGFAGVGQLQVRGQGG